MSSKRNRRAGHSYERDVVKRLREMGWDVHTSRYASRLLDDSGVDIAGDFPYGIQCKATQLTPQVQDLLTTTAADVIFWRKMVKKGKNFYNSGEYAMMDVEMFYKLIELAHKKES